ncbi:hypothetical protein CRYUN_Cryun01aG0159800 [Craigia yunnanensis]
MAQILSSTLPSFSLTWLLTTKLVLAIFLSLLGYAAVGKQYSQSQQAQQCRLQQISRSQPSQRIESEGGVVEFWNQNEKQLQCAGVAALRTTVQPKSLSLPNFQPFPQLRYVLKGSGLLGVTFPGCPETYQSQQQSSRSRDSRWGEQGSQQKSMDQHQKVRRIRQGDILAIPAGAAHWCHNDGNEELVMVAVFDLNNPANQLDQNFRELLAVAFDVPVKVVRKMQKKNNQGLLVKCKERMSLVPQEEGEEERMRYEMKQNGVEETICTMRTKENMENEADFVSRQAEESTTYTSKSSQSFNTLT